MLNNYGNFKCLSDFDKQREIDSPIGNRPAHASPHHGFEAGAAPAFYAPIYSYTLNIFTLLFDNNCIAIACILTICHLLKSI